MHPRKGLFTVGRIQRNRGPSENMPLSFTHIEGQLSEITAHPKASKAMQNLMLGAVCPRESGFLGRSRRNWNGLKNMPQSYSQNRSRGKGERLLGEEECPQGVRYQETGKSSAEKGGWRFAEEVRPPSPSSCHSPPQAPPTPRPLPPTHTQQGAR